MNWFKKLFTKEDWRLVHTLEVSATWDKEPGTVYCYLFESNKGNRKYEMKSTWVGMTDHPLEQFFITTEVYLKTVFPWMAGRKVPGISSYSEVPDDDFMNHIKS